MERHKEKVSLWRSFSFLEYIMELSLASILIAAVAIIVAIYTFVRHGQGISIEGVADVAGGLTELQDAVAEARELVLAAEQLYRTGRLPKDKRFTWVYNRLKANLPNLPEDTLATSVEAAVAWLKLLNGRTE